MPVVIDFNSLPIADFQLPISLYEAINWQLAIGNWQSAMQLVLTLPTVDFQLPISLYIKRSIGNRQLAIGNVMTCSY